MVEMSMDTDDIYIYLSRIDHYHELTWRCGSLKRYSLYAKSWGAWHS
jgi:hypothetical protein